LTKLLHSWPAINADRHEKVEMTSQGAEARVLILRPAKAMSWQDLRDAWEYRGLLSILALRDVKVRYKQASLGIAWALLQPLAQMIIFTVLFNRFAGIKGDGPVPYSIFCMAGLTVWGLFANGLALSSESLINNANLVTKVYFPRVIVPLATILTAAVDSAIAAVFLVGLMVVKHVPFHATALLALPIAGIAALCAAALGQYRDVRHALPFLIQILVYTTPVFYSASMVPQRYRWLFELNPMVAVIGGFRAALFGTKIPFEQLGFALGMSLVIGLLGFIRFRHLEQTFADRI
jgi:lipopolysaccharide transport system permease protein